MAPAGAALGRGHTLAQCPPLRPPTGRPRDGRRLGEHRQRASMWRPARDPAPVHGGSPSSPEPQARYGATVIGLGLLVAAGVLLGAGSELFAEHAGAAARRFGLTTLAVGLLLAGAEPEELVTGIVASARHLPGVAAGDAIGSNVTMLTVVLGLILVARPGTLRRPAVPYALAAAGAGAAAAGALLGGELTRPAGAGLVAAYLLAVLAIWRRERRPPAIGEVAELEEEEDDGEERTRAGSLAPLAVAAGLVAMAAGGFLAVSGADRLVHSLGLSESVVGSTLVALATTAELFALVWAAFRRDLGELALAGLLGSVLYNATATLGVATLVHPLATSGLDGAAWLAAGLPLVLLGLRRLPDMAVRGAGMLLVLAYGVYLGLSFAR